MALGATFSALEVVPLVLIGFEAYENLTLSRARPWVAAYKWPIYFFVAVAFWNLVGAGLFGFLINPPIALYYMQGLNTTPVHGHTALFGVYGMLGIGLMLFCLKGLTVHKTWRTGALAFAFWSINVGLALMVLLSLLPVGLMQTWASVEHGTWYARSAEFMQTPTMDTLRWLRVVGDTIFAVGILALGWFVLGLKTGWSIAPVAGRRRPRILPRRPWRSARPGRTATPVRPFERTDDRRGPRGGKLQPVAEHVVISPVAHVALELGREGVEMAKIRLKRVYEEAAPDDGRRILVERLWPRGLSKGQAAVDLWVKDVAPSPELRRWFNHDPDRWQEFRRRYHAELRQKEDVVAELRRQCRSGTVTFVYAAHDEEHNSAGGAERLSRTPRRLTGDRRSRGAMIRSGVAGLRTSRCDSRQKKRRNP